MKRLFSCILPLLLIASALTACGGGGSSAPASSAAPQSSSRAGPSEEFATEGEGLANLPLVTPSNAEGSKIVYTVDLWLQTTTFAEGARKLLDVVTEKGGYVESAHIEGRSLYDEDAERYASYTLRIPSEHLAEFLVIMEDNYNLVQLDQQSQNITDQYQETDTRLEDLREQEKRLTAALAETEDTQALLALERELAAIKSEISSLTASSGKMDNAVIYSKVTIYLSEFIPSKSVQESGVPFGDRLSKTASGSWRGFVGFCQGLLLFIIAALPVLVVLGVIAVIILLVMRADRKSGGKLRALFTGRRYDPFSGGTPPKHPFGKHSDSDEDDRD